MMGDPASLICGLPKSARPVGPERGGPLNTIVVPARLTAIRRPQ